MDYVTPTPPRTACVRTAVCRAEKRDELTMLVIVIPSQVLKARVLALLEQRDPRRLQDRPRARTSFPSPLCALWPSGPSQWRVGSSWQTKM